MLITNRMIRDAEHFSAKMSKIEGAGDLGEYIVELVKSKPLPVAEVTSIPAPAADSGEERGEEKAEVMFDAADPVTPTPTQPGPEEPAEKGEEEKDEKEETQADPPLPPTPEQMEDAERKKNGGDGAPATAEEEEKATGIEEANVAMGNGLPPTPMEVDGEPKGKGG